MSDAFLGKLMLELLFYKGRVKDKLRGKIALPPMRPDCVGSGKRSIAHQDWRHACFLANEDIGHSSPMGDPLAPAAKRRVFMSIRLNLRP